MEYTLIYFEEGKGWQQDGKDGIKPLSIGLELPLTRGRIIARMIYLHWTFMQENHKGELWFYR